MAFDDRLQFLLLGLAIGTVFGYLIRLLQDVKDRVQDVKEDVQHVKTDVQDVKEELDEVDTIVKRIDEHEKNEQGFMRYPWVANIMVLVVVVLTAYAAFISQRASNEVEAAVAKNEIISDCNNKILAQALDALNERSTYTVNQTQSNVSLQKAQAKFFAILLHQPPYDEAKRVMAAQRYQASLNNFIEVSDKSTDTLLKHQYPTENDLINCVQNGK